MKLTPIKISAVLAIIAIVSFLSIYKPTEAPRTWLDEGLFIQVARNFAHYNLFQVQTAPGEFDGSSIATYITVGYPVIYPLGLVFKFFGVGLLQARILMAGFLVSLVIASFFLIYKIVGYKEALISIFLLASFAPLYGNGKNVLGEVPGLFFLILFLLCVNKLEETNYESRFYHILSGIIAGLAIVTKPIFILLIPAIVISVLWARKRIRFNFVNLLYALVAFFIPLAIYYLTYFGKEGSISSILSFYLFVNDTGATFLTSVKQYILTNLWRFVSEPTPAYFFVLALAWSGYWALRTKLKKPIKLAEEIALVFTVLIGLAYLKIPGAYRYFFPGHVIALLFFPAAFLYVFRFINRRLMRSRIPIVLPICMLVFLTAFQFYQVGFSSWVAGYYHATMSRELDNYFKNFDKNRSIFVYQAPEVVTFIRGDNYFQFFAVSTSLFGDRDLLLSAVPDEAIVPLRNHEEAQKYLTRYKLKTVLYRDRYFVYERK